MVFAFLNNITAQEIDLLIKNGLLIDPKNGVSEAMDVAISDGKIHQVAKNINGNRAQKVIDAEGLYIAPGLIDLHTHNFAGTQKDAMYSNGWNSLAPDGFTFRAGVTTVVDQGCAGWRNFGTFKENIIDKSKTRVLAFVNIVGSGMKGGAVEQNLADMDPKLAAMAVKKYPEIVGVKVAHYIGPEWMPVENAVKAGDLADVPVMVDFGTSEPVLSLETLLMEKLRPGDILTHCYGATRGRGHVVDDSGNLNAFALRAQQRGIIFDVGHGGGSFEFTQGIPAIEQGLKPNSISTDLHIGSMNGGMKDQLNVMSKFLNMGLTLEEVIERSTWNPAQIIKRTDLGHLTVGAEADLVLLELLEGEFGFIDVAGFRMDGTKKLECELTVKGGQVMWDLNGISRPHWSEAKQ
ncbi:MAG: amidohydrolase [Cyclobacteriaceae bacterium]|nr:MAG: amidohydrolase [Cyclobacteriaceae bacterium]